MTMTLKELLEGIREVPKEFDRPIQGLTMDSRTIQSGEVFLACQGTEKHGSEFIKDAIARGASAILLETQNKVKSEIIHHQEKQIPVLEVMNLHKQAGNIAARFYQYPSKHMKVIGITGTNGKTSISQFIAAALHMLDKPCGVIGTLGNGMYGQLQQSSLTTPDAITIQKTLADMKSQGINTVAMEVSSHSLSQDRVVGVEFDTAVFTNLTRDHLDYHRDMKSYGEAKRRLFKDFNIHHAVINLDDEFGREIIESCSQNKQVFGYTQKRNHDVNLSNVTLVSADHTQLHQNGITAHIHSPWGDGVLQSHLFGRFNVSNMLAVISVLGIMGISLPEILGCLAKLQGVPGRMETFGGGDRSLVVVDYAHTPDALKQALEALREHCPLGEIWCVFGCGGDRDQGKRPLMGQIAETLADRIILTDDNPRNESPQEIVADIQSGMSQSVPLVVEHDRRRAIIHAIECAHPDDIILVAGKGHEAYQQIGKEKLPFSDALEIKMLMTE